ncbi:ATP-dependent RecD-like DNA helicase [Pseudobythopirellula maris]|uniref:ATP-dependent RecD-like DNA helicase n=1 Tax=Pseudobythopirellula maris TaxID=2527991 RepID=A0A5C5ZHN1_9BACT|nr:DUF3320 domain-containing protein [Pseudobythopirellula maris]TWT86630.1 ATP-dependent RecD-like DNA helicase [Pseudobythopirellula maris]
MPDLETMLEESRRELLDLSARNRLLNTPRSPTRSTRVEVVDELADQVFDLLAIQGKTMTFLASDDDEASPLVSDPGDGDTAIEATGEVDTWVDDGGAMDSDVLLQTDAAAESAPDRHTDNRLQTLLDGEALEKRLLKLHYDTKTFAEEQGVHVLYLAIGFLVWRESGPNGAERHAPLLLLPVELRRAKAGARFRLSYNGEELTTNLSLQERLKGDFGVELPELPESLEDLTPSGYFASVAEAIEGKEGWRVQANDMVLWMFVFSKIRMFMDLKQEAWPKGKKLSENPLIRSLLGEGFRDEPPLFEDPTELIDDLVSVDDAVHVIDADSSQAMVIEEVRRGRNLVVQGPPGTGKSQTIANMIAAAVHEGKSVLFVAEKMAALEVVHRRLANIGLGDMCLELHSNKANRKQLLQELDRTLKLSAPHLEDAGALVHSLQQRVDTLNGHVKAISAPIGDSGLSPFNLIGEITRLQAEGVRGRDLHLTGCEHLSGDEIKDLIDRVADLADHARKIGTPCEHPWRGCELEALLPTDMDRFEIEIKEVAERIDRLISAGAELAQALGAQPPRNARELSDLAQFAKAVSTIPRAQLCLLDCDAWTNRLAELEETCNRGLRSSVAAERLEPLLDPHSYNADVREAREAIKVYGDRWYRGFVGRYRAASAKLRAISIGAPPRSHAEQLEFLNLLIEHQADVECFSSNATEELGKQALSTGWRGAETDWGALAQAIEAVKVCREKFPTHSLTEVAKHSPDSATLRRCLQEIGKDLNPCFKCLGKLEKTLCFSTVDQLGRQAVDAPLHDLHRRMTGFLGDRDGLKDWIGYRTRCRSLAGRGVDEALTQLDSGAIGVDELRSGVELALYESLMRLAYTEHPALASFSGESHERVREAFVGFDKERLAHCRSLVAKVHWENTPRSSLGEMAVVNREINKKSRHLRVRTLMGKAGRAIQKAKPVFMMSPMSIAQYLPPGEMEFDLLLIDEASQVEPVDAFGAMARAKQVVVVGDTKQLPPTSFFARATQDGEPESEDDDAVRAKDIESILSMCCAKNVTQRMLEWHYRSRHHSLIEFSNHEFYDDRLIIVPSPCEPDDSLGLKFFHIPEAVYDRGGTRANRIEAKRIAEAAIEHALKTPGVSLGVGAFSMSQRDAILQELELLRKANPQAEEFFTEGKDEPFFVKNLENIQGDEREVIYISVGYGKDKDGYMSMSFGPLNSDGGERRLNVLITRARSRCVIFSSIRASDIDTSRTQARGAIAFKAYLQYAETGMLDTGSPAVKAEHDSEFERQVAKALRGLGYETHAQVGVAGFRIDLSVVDPSQPGRYLLGIECDGAAYHSSRSARDRDRIRQSVLEARGWRIHRIWSSDWFSQPDQELRRVVAAIEQAQAAPTPEKVADPPSVSSPAPPPPILRREEPETIGGEDLLIGAPYEVASFDVNRNATIPDTPIDHLERAVVQVVRVEGPIHREEVYRRIAQLWGSARAGRRIVEAIEGALGLAVSHGGLESIGDFFVMCGSDCKVVRDRSETGLLTLKKPEMISHMEIEEAIVRLVSSHVGMSHSEVVSATARVFGIGRISSGLRDRIEYVLQSMVKREQICDTDGRLATNHS